MAEVESCPLLLRCYVSYRQKYKGGSKAEVLNDISTDVCPRCPLDHCVGDYEGKIMLSDEAKLILYGAEMEQLGKLWWRD